MFVLVKLKFGILEKKRRTTNDENCRTCVFILVLILFELDWIGIQQMPFSTAQATEEPDPWCKSQWTEENWKQYHGGIGFGIDAGCGVAAKISQFAYGDFWSGLKCSLYPAITVFLLSIFGIWVAS